MKKLVLLVLVALVMGGCSVDYDRVEPFQVKIAEYVCDSGWSYIDNESVSGNFEFLVQYTNGAKFKIGYQANEQKYNAYGNVDPIIMETIDNFMKGK